MAEIDEKKMDKIMVEAAGNSEDKHMKLNNIGKGFDLWPYYVPKKVMALIDRKQVYITKK